MLSKNLSFIHEFSPPPLNYASGGGKLSFRGGVKKFRALRAPFYHIFITFEKLPPPLKNFLDPFLIITISVLSGVLLQAFFHIARLYMKKGLGLTSFDVDLWCYLIKLSKTAEVKLCKARHRYWYAKKPIHSESLIQQFQSHISNSLRETLSKKIPFNNFD